ncbi:cell division protein ZapB [Thalassobius sp. I31.1]|uniref:cell division protein ZapB n=1 Tax=Thalassobius sp. I31.1 TaxID=2109912 RepID=UPI0013009983|nr:cell division protein ZapB [Thalassobius sp. I31.1]
MRMASVLASFSLLLALPVSAQNFSCSFGRPACLDYGDTVCSSMGKCVSSSAECFESYQCNYEGFACQSDVSDCVEEYENLRGEYNHLVRRYNDRGDTIAELERSQRNLRQEREQLEAQVQDYSYCIQAASTLAGAQACWAPF